MMRRLLLILACLIFWASPSQAAIACTAETNFAFNAGSSTTATLVFPTSTTAGGFKWVAIQNRTDTSTTIGAGDVDGSVDANWTLDQGPINGQSTNTRIWTYYFPNATAGTETVTATFSGSISWQIVGGWCTGAATSSPKDAEATVSNFVTTDVWTTNTATATTAGAIFGACWTGTNSITWTINDGSTILESGGSGQRTFGFYRVVAAGANGFNLTPSSAIIGSCVVTAFKEPAAASTLCCGVGLPRIVGNPGIVRE